MERWILVAHCLGRAAAEPHNSPKIMVEGIIILRLLRGKEKLVQKHWDMEFAGAEQMIRQ